MDIVADRANYRSDSAMILIRGLRRSVPGWNRRKLAALGAVAQLVRAADS
jgi:hypothetical protein